MRPTKLSEKGITQAGVLWLDGPASIDPNVTGAKAAALATARRAGLPVLDGFVISTDVVGLWRQAGTPPPGVRESLRHAWARLTASGASVIVRSSSPNEDTATSSMAGQFRSVLDVTTRQGVLDAARQVIDSARGGPMAVLVQPMIEPSWGGVLFGADPVTGRRDRLVVASVPGGPDKLVSGAVTGSQFALSTRGRRLDGAPMPEPLARRSVRKAFVGLASAAARLFDGPQDIEWALDHDGRLVLLQSRPISVVGDEVEAAGPILGPGPLAETFPTPLAALEEDLWIPPLREGLRRALRLIGGVSGRRLRSSPIVVTIDGHPAIDLELLGLSPVRRSPWARLDPRPPARRLLAAWRVGRLRAALPQLATDLMSDVDSELRSVPALDDLSVEELLRLLERSGGFLTSLHGYEVLAGQLLSSDATAPTGASRALEVLAQARTSPLDDDELVAAYPVLLSLIPPAIGRRATLPRGIAGDGSTDRARAPVRGSEADLAATRREALRLRIRWVQELTARAALAIGEELVRRGILGHPDMVRDLPLEKLRDAVAGDMAAHADGLPARRGTPLPRAFRRAGDVIVPLAPADSARNGRGAGGGRGMGRVHHGPIREIRPGAVLVVPTLDPGLAPLLPGLSGLVAETGSVLSHLAILAREYGVPTVVDLPGATGRYSPGTWVVVDGLSGEVTAVESAEWRAA